MSAAAAVLWPIDDWRARRAARMAHEVWGRNATAWERQLDARTPPLRDSAVAALEELGNRSVLDAATRVRLATHLAQRFTDASPDTRRLAVTAALDVAEPEPAAARALRAAAAGLLAPGRTASGRFAALEVLARLGAAQDDLPLIARTAAADSDADVRALAAAVLERAPAP